MADLAAIFANSMATGIYSTNSPEMCKYMANHSNANIIVVEDDSQLQKILKVKSELPGKILFKIVLTSQYVEADLNKKSCLCPKSILYRSKITLYWKPWKLGMYYKFSKNDILLMQQQLKVPVASSIKIVLWNARFSL